MTLTFEFDTASDSPELIGLLTIIEGRKQSGSNNHIRYANVIEQATIVELEKRGCSVVFQDDQENLPAHFLISW